MKRKIAMKRIILSVCLLCTIACAFAFAACGGSGSGGGVETYVFEAEYTDLTGVQGGGHSNEASGVGMIYGNGTEEEIEAGWSSGYFVAFTHREGVKLTFEFNSSEAVSGATIVLRVGSEMGNLTFTPSSFEVKLNGEAIEYGNMTVENSSVLENMKFYDKTVTANASLLKGKNELTLTVLANSLSGGVTAGPIIDCVKISTKAKLDWNPLTDNPSKRGDI